MKHMKQARTKFLTFQFAIYIYVLEQQFQELECGSKISVK